MISMQTTQVFDWLVSLVYFGVVFSIFRLVVIEPMAQATRQREQRVLLRLAEIDEIAREAKAKQAEFEEKFGNVDAALAEVQSSSERSSAKATQKIGDKAEAEERYVLEKARVEAESIRREVENEIRSRIASRAVVRAEAILGSALDAGTQNAIITSGIKKVGSLNAS